jgi:23S rRNA pseudouridine1911/1915/1917 synthase
MTKSQYHFAVEDSSASRLDKYLSEQLPDVSRSQIQKAIRDGDVNLNGIPEEKTGAKIKVGDQIEIRLTETDSDNLVPEEMALKIIYEDEGVIVVDKPAGTVVHPGAGNPSGTLVNALLDYFPPIRHVGEPDRPGVVHRLDKETSGVLIFAKTDKTYKWLVKQFKGRDTEKRYLALVDGQPPTKTGRIEAPIIRDHKVRTRMAVGLRGQGKPAVSEYFVLETFTNHTFIEVQPITGRTHQIRVHLSYLDVPVVGDITYGRRNPSIEMDRFFLHAKSLSIRLPGDRVPRIFETPLPSELMQILTQLRINERLNE